jgi:hypothetical protein
VTVSLRHKHRGGPYQVDQRQLFSFLTMTSVLMWGDHGDEAMFYTNVTAAGQKYWGIGVWDMEALGSHCPVKDLKFTCVARPLPSLVSGRM